MADLFSDDIEDLRSNGMTVGDQLRPVHLIMMGDYAFMTTHLGHAGATCRMPCLYCTAWARPTKVNAEHLHEYGNMQAGSKAGGRLRTIQNADDMALAYQDVPLAGMDEPLDMTEHLSIDRKPLLVIDVADIAPMPLHVTQGGTGYLLILGVEAVVFDQGPEKAAEYSMAMAEVLRSGVGVCPAPYHGGAFAGKQCHKIAAKLELLCDLLDTFVPASRARAYRDACTLWGSIIPVMNRAEIIPPAERATFRRRVAAF
eukprot:contig_5741_g1292